MKYEFFPVTWTKSNTKPPKLPKALKGLTISQLTMILVANRAFQRDLGQKK